jgi:hypothetical protein
MIVDEDNCRRPKIKSGSRGYLVGLLELELRPKLYVRGGIFKHVYFIRSRNA